MGIFYVISRSWAHDLNLKENIIFSVDPFGGGGGDPFGGGGNPFGGGATGDPFAGGGGKSEFKRGRVF